MNEYTVYTVVFWDFLHWICNDDNPVWCQIV